MKKAHIIILSFIVILLAIAGYGYYSLVSSSTTTAFLTIDGGKVEVDTGKGWVTAEDGMELSLNDKVRTGTGKATVILYESIFVSLEPDTLIEIADLAKEHVKVKQQKGSTWNKFTGLLGIGEYTVETPTTAAIVKGTFFKVDMDSVMVGEGKVTVIMGDQTLTLRAGEKSYVEEEILKKESMDSEEKEEMVKAMQRNIEEMRDLRQREIDKHPTVMSMVKSKYDLTDNDVKDYMKKADSGQLDLDRIEEGAPIKTESVHRVRLLTEQIIEQNKKIEALQTDEET
ncbi:FecR domain-containing protein [Candidatus Woesearchaeota archaeon]|nr:FecR domain-containing protein [Candidatus Woesearchaeota archaeon]